MINRLANYITHHPKTVILVAVLLLVPSLLGFILTPINYDILSYLPDELDSVKGINSLDKDFHEASMSIIVMRGLSWNDMEKLENDISGVENVKSVLWLGAVVDSPIPLSMLPKAVSSMLFDNDGDSSLMIVQFTTPGGSNDTLKAISQIKRVMNKQCLMSGTAALTYDISQLTNTEAPKFILVAIVLALIALGLTMNSFALPIILLITLGMAVLYNMGTNFMFGQISFITQAIAAILQLGVTMDYSVFLMDRYQEEKPKYRTREDAMSKAVTSTFTSLAGSSLTTIFGFLALCFMSFTLGRDIGLVMAKGVLFGILTVVIVLPAMILVSEKLIYKTRHKSLTPSFRLINKCTIKLRPVFSIIFVLLLVPSFLGQQNVKKYYNMMEAVPSDIDSIAALNTLKEDFNMASSYFAIIDDSMPDEKKLTLIKDLKEVEGVSSVLGFNSIVGTAFSENIIPDSIKSMFIAAGKQMVMINSKYSPATDESNRQVDSINGLIKSYDPEAKLTGEAPMYKDLIEVTDRDFIVTNIISIAAIFLLIAIIFKSISIPFILILSIELAIWINISISYLMGEEICFITPTIISCVQLGATVDYAILLTTRFREEIRKGLNKKEAMQTAADSALKSVFQSAVVFFVATFGVYVICDIDIVSSICAMLARGSIVSALVIMLFLTPILVVCEGFINKTTYRWRVVKRPIEFTPPILEEVRKYNKKVEKKTGKTLEMTAAVKQPEDPKDKIPKIAAIPGGKTSKAKPAPPPAPESEIFKSDKEFWDEIERIVNESEKKSKGDILKDTKSAEDDKKEEKK